MTDVKTIEGDFTSGKGNYALVVGRWNSFVVEHLVDGAIDTLRRHGVSDKQITVIRAPGAFEIPLVCRQVAAKGGFDAIVALGAVIRGIAQVSLEYGMPVAFGVLTVDSIEQAVERSGTKAGNKGAEAALSAIEMVSLLGHIG